MDTSLKQRLIGAIVLVALAVIFLPMLVKGPAPDSGVRDVPLKAPAAPAEGQFQTRELPLVAPTGATGEGALGMPATVQAGNPDAADPASTGQDAAAPAVAAGNYAVSFGAYATEADADAVIAFLKKSQLPGFRQADTINGRQAWRVRIGPYADRAQAESVRLQAAGLRSDVDAKVVTLNAEPEPAPAAAVPATPAAPAPAPVAATPQPAPEPPKPAPAKVEPPKPQPAKPAPEPAKPGTPKVATQPASPDKPAVAEPKAPAASSVGFAVQLGAFAQAGDATALRDRVRAAGFSAFVEQVRTDKGTLSRVRVGPVANRAEAEQIKAQVAARVGITGMVVPHP